MLNHQGTVDIETKRCYLRKFHLGDELDMFKNWANNSNVTRYLTWPVHMELQTTKNLVKMWSESYERDVYHWAIVFKETDEVIGSFTASNISEVYERCEIGFCIGENYWGKGLTAEVIIAVNEFLLGEIDFKRVSAVHMSANIASGRAMIKAGMMFEGRLRKYMKNGLNDFVDCELYSIIKE